MNKFCKIALILLFGYQHLEGQNLIPNNSFEEYKKCPEKDGKLNKNVFKWQSPNKATPDYFNSCSRNKLVSTSKNICGTQVPHSGNAYAGIILFELLGKNYREYIQCKLTKPLKVNHLYCCSYLISFADNSEIYTDKIGIYISKEKVKTKDKLVINVKPQIENPTGLFLNNSKDWILICDTFKAKGGEEFITIGNFYNDVNTVIKKVNDKSRNKNINKDDRYYIGGESYYFIDDVSVLEISDASKCNCKEKIKNSLLVANQTNPPIDTIAPQLGESIILQNLVFETNKSEILSGSFVELNKLAAYLKQYTQYKIDLAGHTDNTGKEEDNQKLSEARAKAVAEYLTKNGITKERISFSGYGSTKPLTTNDIEEGRQQNRRVEFVIKE